MRKVTRGAKAAPAALSKRGRDKRTEFERAKDHMSATLPAGTERTAFEFKSYKADEVKRRLEELFHGKCAYCESFYGAQAPVDVEHYRPKGAVEGAPDHPGYWWLAMAWDNLLPSCIDCNRRRRQKTPQAVNDVAVLHRTMLTGKKDCFPISGTRAGTVSSDLTVEDALLLDPTRDDAADHLLFWIEEGPAAGLALPKSTAPAAVLPAANEQAAVVAAHASAAGLSIRGAVSIQIYGLNRLRLVQERARVLQRLRFFEFIIVKVSGVIQTLSQAHLTAHAEVNDAIRSLGQLQIRVIEEMAALAAPEAPYCTIAAAFVDDFKHRLRAV